jgi:hypothetical protein
MLKKRVFANRINLGAQEAMSLCNFNNLRLIIETIGRSG